METVDRSDNLCNFSVFNYDVRQKFSNDKHCGIESFSLEESYEIFFGLLVQPAHSEYTRSL